MLKNASLLLNALFILIFGVMLFLPKKTNVKYITRQNTQEVARLEKDIQDLKYLATQIENEKMRYVRLADSLSQARQPIQYLIKKQNEKIDSLRHLPTMPDTILFRIFTDFEATPKK